MCTIAFTGGGTGGHIYPGLAVAAYLRQRGDYRVFWIGSGAGMDREIVEKAGIPFFGIPAGKLRRYVSLKNCADAFKVCAGFFAARRILRREKPRLLFSKGGFVSVPPCAAAASLGIPVFTHESDFSPGLATRLNARWAERICLAYQETAAFFPRRFQDRLLVCGNPVRPEFRRADPAKGRAFLGLGGGERVLLVLGASQGARQINELVRETLPELARTYTVVHQTGPALEWNLPASGTYRPYPFFYEEMPDVLASAELVLCRSGAGTVWECASLGRPMVLIPLCGSGTRGDQVENARFFERAGAATALIGKGASAEALVRTVSDAARDPERRRRMEQASAEIGRGDAAARIADTIVHAL